jgi:hypothetical protein
MQTRDLPDSIVFHKLHKVGCDVCRLYWPTDIDGLRTRVICRCMSGSWDQKWVPNDVELITIEICGSIIRSCQIEPLDFVKTHLHPLAD